jgi:type IV pilus assembly protein PilY1
MNPTQPSLMKRALAYAMIATIAFPAPLFAAATDISQQPLAQPATNVKPNIMLIFDDSGSMRQQYTPDYLGRYFGGSNALCFDAKDDGGGITGGLDNCEAGDVPMMTPDINTQYYNPEIQYLPAVNYDGSSKTNMTAANTSNWTVVPTDNVTAAATNTFRRTTLDMNGGQGQVNNADLVNGYPDRVWCTAQADSATDTSRCKTNSAYSYPDDTYGYGLTTGGAVKYKTGAPYYYRLSATEYCSDQNLTTCTAATAPTGAFVYPAPVRYCTGGTGSPTTQNFTSCQLKYKETGTTYIYPRFLGKSVAAGAGVNGRVSYGVITVNTQNDTQPAAITSITVNGVDISGPVNLAANFTQAQAATAIKNAINTTVSVPDYHATCTGGATCTASAVTVRFGPSTTATPTPTANGTPAASTGTPGVAPDGSTLTVAVNITGETAATATLTTSGVDNGDQINAVSVGATNLISSGFSCPAGATCGSMSSSNRNNYMASELRNRINATSGCTPPDTTKWCATVSGAVVTVTSPASLGAGLNGTNITRTVTGMTLNSTAFTGGSVIGDIQLSTTNFTNGQDVVPATNAHRTNVGNFTRVDITPFQDPPTNSIPKTFPKYPDRHDCVTTAGVCTYAEEMTNFANWYSYYRSRSQMAKTSIGRAFIGITNAFRVGFITINPTSGTLGTRFLAVNDFNSGSGAQKDLWYQRLYTTSDNGSTPLREALSRVGQYYAGVSSTIKYAGMGASPIQVACQPSYAILVTDGYWNGNGGQNLTGGAIGNEDGADSGYSKRSEARYDGLSQSNTLADVAMYYYKTDLRSDLTDQVPVTTRDPAPHQHMTTFTVGLGLAGNLIFDAGYENGTSPDFERLKIAPASGGLDWPAPVADTETALDDLWHAAVNGRGTFFSAKDPAELSRSIAETLTSVQARVGAGAAAATSNLQPVAGDNFAFTAQYETVTWIGDIKARTIDLSTGTVASRQLWSAAALLDSRGQITRKIFTLDAADTTATAPANGNRLKSFCYPAAMNTAGYPTCTDGAGLDTEMDLFLPLATSPAPASEPKLVQSTPWASDTSGRDVSATKEALVDYLRGATLNEDTGGTAASDLFRNRTSILGDIINAQPAYVKGSPFSYNTGASAGRDPFYTEFKNTTNGVSGTRKGSVYVAANDGMLHAFETDPDNNPYFQTGGIGTTATGDDVFTGTLDTNPATGEGSERWAYIPKMVLPYLKRLADTPYSHRYYTDGSPVVGDVCFGHTTAAPCAAQANWRTVLVAGLNAGGRGYYALDVTDPDNPKALWEIQGGVAAANCGMTDAQASDGTRSDDCNIGLTFGNPLIVKRASDGKWVTIFASGYNNVSPGDGKGYIYVVDIQTGKILERKGTGVGCDGVSTTAPCVAGTVDPSGLGRLNAWVDNASLDNTALTVYAGDLKGNMWRYELDGTAFPTVTVGSMTRLATVVDPSGVAQQISTKPELGLVGGNKRAVFFGTGKFIGVTDKSSLQRNSFYAIKDDMNSITSPVYNMARSGTYPTQTISGFTRQTLTASTVNPLTERTTAVNTDVPFTAPTANGWFIDFPDGGTTGVPSERMNVDPILQLGTLVVPSNVPNSDTCVAGGYGWINFFDYKTGAYIPGATNNMASQKISSSLVVGINVVQLPGGTVKTIVTTADNQQLTESTPVAPSTVLGRRVSWRELFSE